MSMTEMIPISEIDSLIAELQEIYNLGNHWEAWLRLDKVIKDLKEKKTIPAIPISKIDEKIKSLENLLEYPDHIGNEYCGTCNTLMQIIKTLEDLKNEN